MKRIIQQLFKNSRSSDNGIFFNEIEKILGFKPLKIEIYEKAFIHRSTNKLDENGNAISYERLEFLGDAMLSSVIAAHLFKKVPKSPCFLNSSIT